jgi:CheY-like chemotaxis protein
VLLVEDDPATQDMLARWMERDGWAVRTAAHGGEALTSIAEERPALVILDLLMPQMDGFELLERLEADPELSTIPVVVLTSRDLDAAELQRLQRRALAVLQKGTHLREEVLRTVQRIHEPLPTTTTTP